MHLYLLSLFFSVCVCVVASPQLQLEGHHSSSIACCTRVSSRLDCGLVGLLINNNNRHLHYWFVALDMVAFLPSSSASYFLSSALLASLLLIHCNANSVLNPDGTSTHHLHFKVGYLNVTRLGQTKQIVAVNDQFPGPTLYVRQGDQLYVKVSNHVKDNVTIHWHGIRQMFTNWADGPAYITQCPLQPNTHYTYNFTVVREQGTLFWHAHISWLRATVYGALVIMPKKGTPYPFQIQPAADFPIVLGEWWKMDVLDVERYGLADGGGYNVSDATTMNGQPGLLYNFSEKDAPVITVKKGQTYLLRLVNAAMNFQMFFQVAKHKLTVVETDCLLAKPYTTSVIVLAPGQTADVLVTADQEVDDYVMGASVYSPPSTELVPFPEIPTTGHFIYEGAKQKSVEELVFPEFPAANDSDYAVNYVGSLRSLNSERHPTKVPQTVDRHFFFTAGYALTECPAGQACHGPAGEKVGTSINNITFQPPPISILQAYYEETHPNSVPLKWGEQPIADVEDVFEEDFPDMPTFHYNYTGATPLQELYSSSGTKVVLLDYKTSVQLVLQNTGALFFESHPFHLHGYNFFVVGMGLGNYNSTSDPDKFNLVDPPAMNTIAVPPGGWVALRFFTDNPGVWLMHCHFEMHTSWGMMMVWIVKEGKKAHEKLPPPPKDYPKCSSSIPHNKKDS